MGQLLAGGWSLSEQPVLVLIEVEVQVQVLRDQELPPGGRNPGGGQMRRYGHSVYGRKLIEIQARQCGDVPDGDLESPERA